MRVLLLFLFTLSPLMRAQTAGGVSAEWDVRTLLNALASQTAHLRSVLEKVNTGGMVNNGAPQAYVTQWGTAQNELKNLLVSVDNLSKQPERMPLALDAYFRMQSMEATLGSVFEGIRRYQNPAIADLLQSFVNENSTNRDRLRQYIQDLAVQKEQEFQVADQEAQRCRASLLQQTRGKRQ